MAKREISISFFVEPTEYGWAVRSGAERLGLFMTQQQALADVKRRRANLKAKGQHSTLVVIGTEPDARPSRPYWSRR